MSTLNVTNLPTQEPRMATAWVNFNGTGTVAIRDQFNVSSITDNGTGDYTINFNSLMSNINYAASTSSGASASYIGSIKTDGSTYTRTTGTISVISFNTTSAAIDVASINVVIQGGT